MPVATDEDLPLSRVEQAVEALFIDRGLAQADAALMARTVVDAEWQGVLSHGLSRLPGYVSSMRSGWINVRPTPRIEAKSLAIIAVDADNGFAQIALDRAADRLIAAAEACGLAALFIRNSHHFAALYQDTERFARAGWAALACVNTRSRMIAPGGSKKLLGTNPMAFAFPRQGGSLVSWDQASSAIAHGEVLLAAKEGRPLPPGTGFGRDGQPTVDPAEILNGGLAPFAGHKGFCIALMIEMLVAAIGGARFGCEDESGAVEGAVTSNAGELILLLNPKAVMGDLTRAEELFVQVEQDSRLPGSRRKLARERETPSLRLRAEHLDLVRPYLGSV